VSKTITKRGRAQAPAAPRRTVFVRDADYLVPLVDDLGADADARWFRYNAGRRYRVRPPTAGEVAATGPLRPGLHLVIAIKQLRPGVRFRVGIVSSEPAPVTDPGEEVARATFEGEYRQ
jgi:hypothetical protein